MMYDPQHQLLPTYLLPHSPPSALSYLPTLESIFSPLTTYTRSKIFVSYHHELDRRYYEEFSSVFCDTYDVLEDNSPERAMDSDDVDYIMRRLRENHIRGSSCTIVLCGINTPWRKFVDWEIKATLDEEHALIGVVLPTCRSSYLTGGEYLPDRLKDNIDSGYAICVTWADLIRGGAAFLSEKVLHVVGCLLSKRINT